MTPDPIKVCLLKRVALVETVSFAILLVCSVLKRTTSFDAVPVMGPIHGVLFLGLVALVLTVRESLGWSLLRTALVCTVGSPFAHFFVRGLSTAPASVPA